MIDETLRHVIEPELRDGEKLLWLEEIDLKPILRKRWFWNIIFLIGTNVVILGLYFFQIGDLNLKTITVLLAGLNMGGVALMSVEASHDFKVRKVRALHAISDRRVFTTAWGNLPGQSVSQIPFSDMKEYKIQKQKSMWQIVFYAEKAQEKLSAVFQIHTTRAPSDIQSIIPLPLNKD